MIVDITTFNQYTNNFEDTDEAVSLKLRYLKSAQEVVEAYLGYMPESRQYKEYLSGIGHNRLYLHAHPVTEVTRLAVSGVAVADYSLHDEYIRLDEGVFPCGNENVVVEYTAGWSATDMPETIVVAILNIAALMMQESNGNIGITGKSFGDNSRTFINYTNYDKWLVKLDQYRVMRLS